MIKVTPLRGIIFIQCIVYYHIIIIQILVWLLFLYLDLYRNICKGTVVLSLLGLEIVKLGLLKRIRVDQTSVRSSSKLRDKHVDRLVYLITDICRIFTKDVFRLTTKVEFTTQYMISVVMELRIGNKIVVISFNVVANTSYMVEHSNM